MFATAFYLVADSATARLGYAAAGNPQPIHLQRQARTAAPLPLPPGTGPALGLFPEANYAVAECPLTEGDVLLLFTDGLFEVTDPDGAEEYGRQRLLDSARELMHLPTPQLCDTLIARVRDFANGAPFADDVCLLGMDIARLRKPLPRGQVQNQKGELVA
jgi:sigma-B regulation protein RsbU (phosphoserine phosphatase)